MPVYLRYELLRTFRNKRFLLFSLVFPVILYFVIAGQISGELEGTSIPARLYFMSSIASFGTMMATISSGARIATERQSGWTRQLRISPLSAQDYLRTKVATAYVMAMLTIALLYASGVILGVRLPAHEWLAMTGLMLVALVPFAALGILLGHLLNADSIGPATGGGVSVLALVSGTWFPVGNSGFVHDLAQCLPSYWLAQASRAAVGGQPWEARGWLVVAAWAVVLSALAVRVYRRDTGRI